MTDEQMTEWIEEQTDKMEIPKNILLIPAVPSRFLWDRETGKVEKLSEADWNHFTLVTKTWKYDINLS